MTIADQIGAAVENIKLRQLIRQAAIIEERERLARDIHDQVTQSIYSTSLFAEAARGAAMAGNMDKVQEHTQSILRTTNLALRELRLLLFELRTEALARRGLVDALRERVRTVEQRAGIAARVHAQELGVLPVSVEEAFYRIALEALNNALRHARAGRVDVTLNTQADEIMMTIADDGIGFDFASAAESGGMGLESMQKRADKLGGGLTIRTRPGNGTLIIARAPLARPSEEPANMRPGENI
jgi:signal transduction histidine kinase